MFIKSTTFPGLWCNDLALTPYVPNLVNEDSVFPETESQVAVNDTALFACDPRTRGNWEYDNVNGTCM